MEPERADRPRRPRFEGWIDRQVREAIERGEFDNLPGAGKPIPGLGRRQDDDWWIRAKLEREGIAPPLPSALQLRREREEIQQALADVRDEGHAREIVEAFNERVRQHYLRGSDTPHVFVRTLSVDSTLAEWRRRREP